MPNRAYNAGTSTNYSGDAVVQPSQSSPFEGASWEDRPGTPASGGQNYFENYAEGPTEVVNEAHQTQAAPQAEARTTFSQTGTNTQETRMATNTPTPGAPKQSEPSTALSSAFRRAPEAVAGGVARASEGQSRPEVSLNETQATYSKPDPGQQRVSNQVKTPEKPQKAPAWTPRQSTKAQQPQRPQNYVQPMEPKVEEEDKLPTKVNYPVKNKRVKKATDAKKEEAKASVHNKGTLVDGEDIVTKLVAGPSADVGFEDISVGTDIVREIVRTGGSTLLNRVNKAAQRANANSRSPESYMKDNWDVSDFIDEAADANLERLMREVNSLKIWVTVSKSPISEPESYQARTLKMHRGAGLKIHPWAVKAFNADFDGDGATLHFSGKNINFARRATAYLIGTDGSAKLDSDYVINLFDGKNRELIEDVFDENFVDVAVETRELCDAYIKYCETGDIGAMLKSWYATIKKEGARYPLDKMAKAVDLLYGVTLETKRQNIDNKLNTSGFVSDSTKHVGVDFTLEELNAAEKMVVRMYEEAREGKMPPNYQQFIVQNAGFVGDVAKKNAHFRVGANVSKLIKRSEKTYIGEKGLYELWHHTAMACMSTAMNARAYAGETTLQATEWLRNAVVSEVGFPSDYDSLEQWGFRFQRSWNRHAAIVNLAGFSYDSRMRATEGKIHQSIRKGFTLGDLVRPAQTIYGQFTVGKLVGDKVNFSHRFGEKATMYDSWKDGDEYYVLHKFKDMPLDKFMNTNHMSIDTNIRKNKLHDTKQGWYMLLQALADTRTGESSKYNQEAATAMVNMRHMLIQWKKLEDAWEKGDVIDSTFDKLTDSVVSVIYETQPAMFGFYGMDNPTGFFNSEYGQALLSSNTGAMLAVRSAMVYDWRTNRLKELYKSVKDATGLEYVERQSDLAHEHNILRSASDVWRMIVDETVDGNKNFKRYMETGKLTRKRLDGTAVDSHAAATGFFNVYETSHRQFRWRSIKEFMQDTSVDWEYKSAVLCDMVIETGGFISTRPEEILFQLEQDVDSAYAGLNLNGYEKNAGSPWPEANTEMVRIAQSLERSRGTKEVSDEAIRMILEDPAEVSTAIPGPIYMDAVFSPMEKESADSEKNSQTARVNAGYQSLVMALDGGFTTELRTVDSMCLGRMNAADLTKKDFYDVFFNGKTIDFFDEYGRMGTLSHDTLVGKMSDEEFLKANPQLMSLLKQTIPTVTGHEGEVTIAALPYESMSTVSAAAQELMNHPGYAALRALTTPLEGKNAANAASVSGWNSKLNNVLRNIKMASIKGDRVDLKNEKFIKDLNALDIDRRKWGLDELAQNLGDEVADLLMKYSEEVEITNWTKIPDGEFTAELTFDIYSANAYYDVRQTMSGAKTASSTGIEGYETERHMLLQSYFMTKSTNRYRMVSDLDQADRERLADSMTTDGVPLSESFSKDAIVVDTEYDYTDETLDDNGNQMNDISRFFSGKRSKSGEDHSLKTKKSGLDGKDAIIKNRKFSDRFYDWNEFRDNLDSVYFDAMAAGSTPEGALEKARLMLAKRIAAEDARLDYENYGMTFYMNIASVMCVPNYNALTDEYDAPIIRSLDQISTAVNNLLPTQIDFGSMDWGNTANEEIYKNTINGAIERIMADVGKPVSGASVLEAVYKIPRPAPELRSVATGVRKHASSIERNLKAMQDAPALLPYETLQKLDKVNREKLSGSTFETWLKNNDAKIVGVDGIDKPCSGSNCVVVLTDIYVGSLASTDDVVGILKEAQRNKMAVAMPGTVYTAMLREIGKSDLLDANTVMNADGIIYWSYFDRELNGYGDTQAASFWLPSNTVTWTVEDPDFRFDYGDAMTVITEHLMNRITNEDTGVYSVSNDSLFRDTVEAMDGCRFRYRMATAEEIYKVNMSNLDLGISESNRLYEDVWERTRMMMNEFFMAWDGDVQYLSESHPDRIVGFAACDVWDPVTRETSTVYAPLIPFRESGSAGRKAPNTFRCVPVYNADTGNFDVMYKNTTPLKDQAVKMHEGAAAANKTVAFLDPVDDLEFANGVKIDNFVAEQAVSGRLNGDNKRIATLEDLFFEMYTEESGMGYNWADAPGTFPENDDIKYALMGGRLPMEFWASQGNIRYCVDDEMNAFVKTMVSKCLKRGVNPSDFLANQYFDGEKWIKSRMAFEWKTVMETSYTWEDAFLKFMNYTNPDLCPAGIYGETEGCLYRVCTEKNWNFGCLLKWVPYPGKPGLGSWCVVRGHFGMFGEDNTANKRASLNGATIENQALIINSHSGKAVPGSYNKYMRYATSKSAPWKLNATTPSSVMRVVKK